MITNRRARYDYEILEKIECGIVLTGAEVKSLRAGRGNLSDAYGVIRSGEAVLYGFHIPPWDFSSGVDDAKRPRKLLLHRREIDRLVGKTEGSGLTLIPLRVYLKGGLVKVEVALARGKRKYDKRAAIRDREHKREMQRALKDRQRGN